MRFRGAGEMAQSLKYLPYTHEDWSSNPMLKPTISALGKQRQEFAD